MPSMEETMELITNVVQFADSWENRKKKGSTSDEEAAPQICDIFDLFS